MLDDDNFPDPIIEWQSEAAAIIRDVQNHVREIVVSKRLPSERTQIFLNVTTLEAARLCVRISCEGFQVVGRQYDVNDSVEAAIYETPYALLNAVSGSYTQSFGDELTRKLSGLL